MTLCSLHDLEHTINVKLSIIPQLPHAFPPNRKEEIAAVLHLKDLALANPDFGGPLDILIESLDYGRCIYGSLRYHLASNIAALPTLFGWSVAGPMDYTPPTSATIEIGAPDESLTQDIEHLWELEKTPEFTNLTPMDNDCISHFQDTHSVKPDGRYVVCLPRIAAPPEIGTSRMLAVQRFRNECSFQRKGKVDLPSRST